MTTISIISWLSLVIHNIKEYKYIERKYTTTSTNELLLCFLFCVIIDFFSPSYKVKLRVNLSTGYIFSIISTFKLVVNSISCIFVSEDLSEDSDCLPRFPPPLETVFVARISFFAGRSEEAILLRTDFRPPPPESTQTTEARGVKSMFI